jgi:hypothetical protein
LVRRLLERLRAERGVDAATLAGWAEAALQPSSAHRLPARLLDHLPLPPPPRAADSGPQG